MTPNNMTPATTTTHAIAPNTSIQCKPSVRLGFRLVKGLSQAAAKRILACRQQQKIHSLSQLTHLAQLNRHDLDCLAHANALVSLCGHRFQARWQVQGVEEHRPLLSDYLDEDPALQHHPQAKLPIPSTGEEVTQDYASTGLTLKQHPMSLLRQHPQLKGCKCNEDLPQLRHGQFIRIAGLVTGRQRPGSASGAVFLTLEDETGNTNVIVWKDLSQRQRKELLRSKLLKIKGVVERADKVIHVIAGHLEDCTDLLGDLSVSSRDFH
jgi:error-prone DNA polymerase